jgi:hypothetical protein
VIKLHPFILDHIYIGRDVASAFDRWIMDEFARLVIERLQELQYNTNLVMVIDCRLGFTSVR